MYLIDPPYRYIRKHSIKMDRKKIMSFKKRHKTSIYLILIVILALYFRQFNINWDSNYYFHPDERAIVMYTTPLAFPHTLEEFFSKDSPLNPHFFAYGNLPLYILKLLGDVFSHINPQLAEYGGIHIIGRFVSAIADTLSVIVVFLIARRVFSKKAGLFASLLYAVSVFPIQAAHFYAVDSLLTLTTTLLLLLLLQFISEGTLKRSLLIGAIFGLSLAIKASAAIFAIHIIMAVALRFSTLKYNVTKNILSLACVGLSTIIIFVITQPYAIIDYKNFIAQTQLQSQMSKDAFLFPYTLQYVGKIPYVYEISNIFFWGQGPIIFIFSLLGLIAALRIIKRKGATKERPILFLIISFSIYFLIFGSFAVGWMRYMLPIYPLLSIFGGYFIANVLTERIPKKIIKNGLKRKILLIAFILVLIVYPSSFLSIYKNPNTRIQASDWIAENIPPGSYIAVEHWDDGLPVYGGENYTQLTLPLYEPDTPEKWTMISSILSQTDYIVIASNRLYMPLSRLTNCKKLPPGKCYTTTSKYYRDLFSHNLGFHKVAEFSEYPTVPFTKIKLIDDGADESFTVYDHPKIMIFKKD